MSNPNTPDRFYPWMQRHSTKIFIALIIIAFISPWLFTRPWNILDFTGTGQIGDTIGGLTAPFINLLAAILVYLTFKEQIESNNLTRHEFHLQSQKEMDRLKRIKEIILWDLEYRIKPAAISIRQETVKYIPEIGGGKSIPLIDHVDFNRDIFLANSLNDYFEIFNKNPKDLYTISNFYNRVEFIYNTSPLRTDAKLRAEKLDAAKVMFRDQAQKDAYFNGLNEKYSKNMESLIANVDTLITQMDEFLAKYK